MKSKFELGSINVQGVKIENIKVDLDYSIEEMFKIVDLIKYATESIPEILNNLGNSYIAFQEINKYIANLEHQEENNIEEEYIDEEERNNKEVEIFNSLAEFRKTLEKRNIPEDAIVDILKSLESDLRQGKSIVLS